MASKAQKKREKKARLDATRSVQNKEHQHELAFQKGVELIKAQLQYRQDYFLSIFNFLYEKYGGNPEAIAKELPEKITFEGIEYIFKGHDLSTNLWGFDVYSESWELSNLLAPCLGDPSYKKDWEYMRIEFYPHGKSGMWWGGQII